jgi:Na+/H+-dicarboxylate symporter
LAEPEDEKSKETRDGPRVPIATQVLLALAIGALTGIFLGEIVAPLKIVGDAFIRLLQITVLPYISIALITGLGRLEFNDVKRLAVKGGTILLLLWGVAISPLRISSGSTSRQIRSSPWPTGSSLRSLFSAS